MHVKKIYRNEAVEGQRFNITNTSAALSKATGLDWNGTQFGRVINSSVNWSPDAKKTISVEDAFKALEAGKQAAKDAGWRVWDDPHFRASVMVSKGPSGVDGEFKTFDEYKMWAKENPKVADTCRVIQIGLSLRDGLKKKESTGIDAFVKEAASKIASVFEGNYRMLDTMTYVLRDCVWALEGTPYDLNAFAIKTFGLPDGKTEKTYKILRDKRPEVEDFWDKLVDALEGETWTLEGAYS